MKVVPRRPAKLHRALRFRFFLAVSLLAAAPLLAAPLALIVPSSGAVLRGDQFATISWAASGPLHAEEWEAFLSLDGGRYYSARLTPHLDLGIRTFTFVVPNVASDDVSILIRVGDERTERIIEFPQRFSIRVSPSIAWPRRFRSRDEAESARPGDPAVVQWATGARDGSHIALIAHSVSRTPSIRRKASARRAALQASISRSSDPHVERHPRSLDHVLCSAGVPVRPAERVRDLLTATHRLNV